MSTQTGKKTTKENSTARAEVPLFKQQPHHDFVGQYEDILDMQQMVGNRAVGKSWDSDDPDVTNGVPPIVKDVLKNGDGQPLDMATRVEMEARFGHDFSSVRVHTNQQAAKSAEAVDARAYTLGSDIAFAANQFMPYTSFGKHLLAHELAHVVQQSRGGPMPRSEINDIHEQDADRASKEIISNNSPIIVECATGIGLARAPKKIKYLIPDQQIYQIMEQMSFELAILRKTVQISSGPREEGMRTFCIVKVVDEKGQIKLTATGSFLGKGAHAEQNALNKIDPKRIAPSDTLLLIVDQWPCREQCRSFLHKFKTDVAGEFRVLTRVNLDLEGFAQSPKTPAKRGDISKAQLFDIEEFYKPRQTLSSATPSNLDPEPISKTPHAELAKSSSKTPTPPEIPKTLPEVHPTHPEVVKTSPGVPNVEQMRNIAEVPPTSRISGVPNLDLNPPPSIEYKPPLARSIKFIPFPIGRAPNEITRLYRFMKPIMDFLKSFGELIGAAVQIALEIVNAVEVYRMAVSGLAGRGFIFTELLESCQELKKATATMLATYQSEEYQQLSISNFLEMLQIAGSGSREAKAALVDEASFMLGLVEMRLDEVSKMYEHTKIIKGEVDEKKQVAEQVLNSKEFAGLTTGFMGTLPLAQVFAVYSDMTQISPLMNDVLMNTKTLIQLIGIDKQRLEVFSK